MSPFLRLDGLSIQTHPDVYEPHDDSLLLARNLGSVDGKRLLEIGCGTGFVSLTAAKQGARVLAIDIQPGAVRLARANADRNRLPLDAAVTDLAGGLRLSRFDRVVCNPPYLPTRPDEHVEGPLDAAFDGGPDGRNLSLRLLAAIREQVEVLRPGFEARIVTSSLQGPADWVAAAAGPALLVDRAADQRMPYEELVVWRLRRADTGP